MHHDDENLFERVYFFYLRWFILHLPREMVQVRSNCIGAMGNLAFWSMCPKSQSKVEGWFQVITVKGLERVPGSLEWLWSRDLKEVWVFRICLELISPNAHQIAGYSDSLKEHIISLIFKRFGKGFWIDNFIIWTKHPDVTMWRQDFFFIQNRAPQSTKILFKWLNKMRKYLLGRIHSWQWSPVL